MSPNFLSRVIRTGLVLLVLFSTCQTVIADVAKPVAAKKNSAISLVGNDVGLCVQFNNLNRHLDNFDQSATYRRLASTTVFKAWQKSTDHKKLQSAISQIENITGKPLGKLAKDLFGKSVILAVYPQVEKEPAGVLLIHSTRQVLDHALGTWKRAAPFDVITPITFQKKQYFRRTGKPNTAKNNKPVYYVLLGDVFAISDREFVIKKIIRLSEAEKYAAKKAAVQSISELPVYRSAMQKLSGQPAVTAFFNPRAWDETIRLQGNENEKQSVPLAFWKHCKSIAVGMRFERGFVTECAVDFEKDQLPGSWVRFARRTAGNPDFLSCAPERTLALFAGRYDPELISDILRINAEKKDSSRLAQIRKYAKAVLLGLDLVTDILPHFKENIGIYVVPRATSQKNVIPFDFLAALELDNTSPQFRTRLENGLANGMTFLTTLYNFKVFSNEPPATVKTVKRQGTVIHWVDQIINYRPAVALTKNYFVIASSPNLIGEFMSPTKKHRLVNNSEFQKWKREFFPDTNQLIFLNIQGVRNHLNSMKPAVLQLLSKNKNGPAGPQLDRVLDLLQIVDSVFVAAKIRESHVKLVFGSVLKKTPAKPSYRK